MTDQDNSQNPTPPGATPPTSTVTSTPRAAAASNRRPLILLVVLVLVAGAWALYYFVFARGHVSTNDAYVNGNLVRITPQVSGTVVGINTDETQFVRRGAVLVQLDPRDAEVALAQAKANLAQTVRDVAQLFAQEQRDAAQVRSQQVQLDQANQDVARDHPLIEVHGVSQETLQHEQNAVHTAHAGLAQAEATLAATRAAVSGTSPATHPPVPCSSASR
jgi:membrane fusion protein, multidrug efflux system